jgi:glycosyltransferase involved in cell wall biosynthesis
MAQQRPLGKVRVLLVPDYRQWILGRTAQAIADANPWIEATILTEEGLADLIRLHVPLADRVDLVHFLWEPPYNRFSSLFRERVPCVSSVHHVDLWETTAPSLSADAIMYVSDQWRDEMVARGVPVQKLWPLPNGVDTDLFRPARTSERMRCRRRLGLAEDALAVGFVGKRSSDVAGRKGIQIFVRAIRELRQRVPKVVPVIVGPGWDDVVADLRREGARPIAPGFIASARSFAEVYRCLDLYWVTSRVEGGPVPLLEAMATGVCCISTPVGAARDVIRDGENALFVPFDDPTALVASSAQLLRDPERRSRIGEAARRTIVAGYRIEQTARGAGALYAAALRSFSERTGRPVPQDASVAQPPALRVRTRREGYLAAVPPELRSRVRMNETLYWMRHLVSHGAYQTALAFGLRACLHKPLNRAAWKMVVQVALETTRPAAIGQDV